MCPNMERRRDWIIDVRLPRADTMALNSIEFSNWIKRKSINTTEEKAEQSIVNGIHVGTVGLTSV